MTEPTTPTAMKMIEEWFPGGGDGLDSDLLAAFKADLSTIEAEARQQERERLRYAIGLLPGRVGHATCYDALDTMVLLAEPAP
jgi:hypothetical protein